MTTMDRSTANGQPGVQAILIACLNVTSDEGALAWLAGPLERHLGRAGGARIPSSLARLAGLEPAEGPVDMSSMLAVAPLLVRYMAGRGMAPGRAVRVSVADAISGADVAARKELERAAQRDRRLTDADLALAVRSDASIEWSSPSPGSVRVTINLGRVRALVQFSEVSEGRWARGWVLDSETKDCLARRHMQRKEGGGAGTGLFPKIDAALKGATRDFLDRYQPGSLEIYGDSTRKNEHNAGSYATALPEEYGLELLLGDGAASSASGVHGIAIRRLPSAGPGVPDPIACESPDRRPDEGLHLLP